MTDFANWPPRPTPGLIPLDGRRVRLEPFDASFHEDGVFAAVGGEANADMWKWMPAGPFLTPRAITNFLKTERTAQNWRTLVIRSTLSGEILGMASYMRIREAHGSAEIGCVAFGPKIRRTPDATEALYLMARNVFALGYRRYEWKCDEANTASKRAAERFGFTFEGVFRNDMVVKERSRNTAWYSITDVEWPTIVTALEQWLAPANFAADGAQKQTLESLRSA